MALLGLFLKYIFLAGVLVALFVIGVVVYFMMRVKHMARQFQQAGAGMHGAGTRQGRASAGPRTGSANSGGTANGGAGYGAKAEEEPSYVADEELYDSRSEREANRKIFGKDEGEYVEFEEEK